MLSAQSSCPPSLFSGTFAAVRYSNTGYAQDAQQRETIFLKRQASERKTIQENRNSLTLNAFKKHPFFRSTTRACYRYETGTVVEPHPSRSSVKPAPFFGSVNETEENKSGKAAESADEKARKGNLRVQRRKRPKAIKNRLKTIN